MRTFDLLKNATTTVTGDTVGSRSAGAQNEFKKSVRGVSANGTTTSGSGSATIVIDVSNNGTAWTLAVATITLTLGTSVTADGLPLNAPFKFMRARVTAISGTGASVNAMVTEED